MIPSRIASGAVKKDDVMLQRSTEVLGCQLCVVFAGFQGGAGKSICRRSQTETSDPTVQHFKVLNGLTRNATLLWLTLERLQYLAAFKSRLG